MSQVWDKDLLISAYEQCGGNATKAAKSVGCSRSAIQRALKKSKKKIKPIAAGSASPTELIKFPVPKTGVQVYILTSAQNNTYVHDPVWNNLKALAEYRKGKILCASYTYNQNAFGKLSIKRGATVKHEGNLWYDPKIEHLLDDSDRDIELAPGLVWCGRTNTLPTATRPLTGLETYTGRKSGIFPHAKLAMESIPSGKYEPTKFNYTTGTITQLNYIQKREGIRAEKYHSYGGLIVEVSKNGWYVRQLEADKNGTICDLDIIVENGKVRKANVVEAINWGDIHVAHLDPDFAKLAWSKGGMLDQLKPKYQLFHDTLDFYSRNHWNVGNTHAMFDRFISNKDSVSSEIELTAKFLDDVERPWCENVVVNSNHDLMLERWLKEEDYRTDPVNAVFFLEMQLAKYKAIAARKPFSAFERAARNYYELSRTKFLREDESFIVCKSNLHPDGIEMGMHGHLGVDGAKGNPRQFVRMSRPCNTGHTHKASIMDAVFTAGHSAVIDHGYNKGPGTWSCSHIITYVTGARCVVTYWNGGYRGR